MKQFIAAVVIAMVSSASTAQVPSPPAAPIVTPVHKKAAPAPKHKKATVKKERTKKAASF